MNTSLLDRVGNNPTAESLVASIGLMAIIYGVSYWMGVEISWNPVEIAAVWTSFVCTYLCVVESRLNYIWGVVTTALYSYLFYQSHLVGSMVLNLYLVPTLIYGWFIWGPDDASKKVEWVKWKYIPIYLGATIATYLGALWIVTYFGGSMAPLDSWILIGTILAQYLLDRKKLQTWFVWVAVNLVSIYVYYNSGLYLVTIQYVFFLLNTVFGWAMWNKSLKNHKPVFGRQIEA